MNPLMTRNQKLSDQSEMFSTSLILEKNSDLFLHFLYFCALLTYRLTHFTHWVGKSPYTDFKK